MEADGWRGEVYMCVCGSGGCRVEGWKNEGRVVKGSEAERK